MKTLPRRILIYLSFVVVAGFLLTALAVFGAYWYFGRQLPPMETLRDLQLQVPLRVMTHDGKLIGEFGAERRTPLKYDEFSQRVIDAFIAAEDDRFFEHPGVDWQGLVRAALQLAATGEKSQGGSTITMQLARNVFLTPERSYVRKIKEILLALRIEDELSKQEILETYLNKIFLGQRAYGVGAAAQVYFGVSASELSLSQAAVLAGLPKAPSRDNPISSPERARDRRNYVLRRMRELGLISELDYRAALAEPIVVEYSLPPMEVDARYVAEMVRAQLFEQMGEAVYTEGLVVRTTIDSTRQLALNEALRTALSDYDERRGWRGPEAHLPAELLRVGEAERDSLWSALAQLPAVGELRPAVVLSFSAEGLRLLGRDELIYELAPEGYAWARLTGDRALQVGDVVRVRRVGDRWRLAQVPQAQGAMVALDPQTGALQALSGGYDFLQNKYNRAIQAQRQPGSGFKPFLYASAFHFGFTPASVVLDAPVVFDDAYLEGAWRPQNYGGDYKGPMRLREALVQSRNLVSVRLLQAIGIDFAQDYIARFGLPKERMPRDLSMSLGSGTFTPMEMARAYSVLANGGFLIDPYFIEDIVNGQGQQVFVAQPRRACADCAEQVVAEAAEAVPPAPADDLAPRVIEAPVCWLVSDILRDVVVRGTATRARALGRSDIGGKTGTTNDETDAWFYGFNEHLVAVSWVGFDQPTPLGRGEVGGRAALPMWIDFMRVALDGVPESIPARPAGLMSVRINAHSGRLTSAGDPQALFESVQADRVPKAAAEQSSERAGNLQDLF